MLTTDQIEMDLLLCPSVHPGDHVSVKVPVPHII